MLFISSVSNGVDVYAAVMIVTYEEIDWNASAVSGLKVLHVVQCAEVDAPSEFVDVSETTPPQQFLPSWTKPSYYGMHGPTFRPGSSKYIYWGTWTNWDLVVIDIETGALTTERYEEAANSHGFTFNPSGDMAIAAGYYFDAPTSLLGWKNRKSKLPTELDIIDLVNGDDTCGSYVHYASWYDETRAFVATMQLGSTSITDCPISGPGIYVIDADTKTATWVAGTSNNKNEEGVWNSASDILLAKGADGELKLYVSEEATLDANGNGESDGSVGVWRIKNDLSLEWIKRLYHGSGDGVPPQFGVGHGSARCVVSEDEEYVFVQSYTSDHIIKIDTRIDKVVKTWDSSDGLSAPHGAFCSGQYR